LIRENNERKWEQHKNTKGISGQVQTEIIHLIADSGYGKTALTNSLDTDE